MTTQCVVGVRYHKMHSRRRSNSCDINCIARDLISEIGHGKNLQKVEAVVPHNSQTEFKGIWALELSSFGFLQTAELAFKGTTRFQGLQAGHAYLCRQQEH